MLLQVQYRDLRRIVLVINDIVCISLAFLSAIYLRFEALEPHHYSFFLWMVPASLPFALAIFSLLGLYRRSVRYASIPDLMAIVIGVTAVTVLKLVFALITPGMWYSRAVLVMDWMLGTVFLGASRMLPRIMLNIAEIEPLRTLIYGKAKNPPRRVLIFGAGRAGESVVREIRRNENLPYEICGFLDDDPQKLGKIIHGVEILGNRKMLKSIVDEHTIDEIFIALPSAPGEEIREIMRLCRGSKVRFKTLPGMQELIEGKLLSMQLRDISVEDLLRRPPSDINLAEIAAYITGKIVLVTGAGGSIGSEICRQILPFQPSLVLLLGHGENSIYTIHQELSERPDLGHTKLVPIIADVQHDAKIRAVFREHQPNIVFHAAAHKHVPLMESNPEEAIKNNILGTSNLVHAAHDAQVERFVMISTDKAVNPTSVMGATKRFAEMIMKSVAKKSPTRFCAVRFGNVLGSRGSVVPLFKKQIERGGPVTVTHPSMIRYFMTIPEASKLVIQAGSYGKGGEVFLLDMGDPVKIADLAADLIRLAGLEEGKDIKIEYSGLRPGEKLFEELLTAEEGVSATRNKKIFIARPEVVDEDFINAHSTALLEAADAGNRTRIINLLREAIPAFAPDRDQIFNMPKTRTDMRQGTEKPKGRLRVV